MLKRYCDVCGKDITLDFKICTADIFIQSNYYKIIKCDDVCEDCANKIRDFIKTLKKE